MSFELWLGSELRVSSLSDGGAPTAQCGGRLCQPIANLHLGNAFKPYALLTTEPEHAKLDP